MPSALPSTQHFSQKSGESDCRQAVTLSSVLLQSGIIGHKSKFRRAGISANCASFPRKVIHMSFPKSTPVSSRISGALELNGQQFPFYVECRTVDLGLAGPVEYYYMPISRLRHDDAKQEVSNFRSCIGFWYAATRGMDGADQWIQQVNYVLAICYALVNRDKGSQRIYRDALLRPHSFSPEKLNLSAEVRDRIVQAVACRNREALQRELDVALEAAQLSEEDRIATSRAMDHWVNRGVLQLREGGRDGLRSWLADVDEWVKRFRKKSTGRLRTFLDVFATECKLSFYLCYSNFWIGLVRWLEENRGLDPMSKRFLSLWHFQNRYVEVAHGRTPSGIIYPTDATCDLLLPDSAGAPRMHQVSWKTNHAGPEVIGDVFRGQVLALHPLNWILLSRTELCEKVGKCVSSSRFTEAMHTGRVR